MERATGIEPAYPAWEAGVLPLNYARKLDVEKSVFGIPIIILQSLICKNFVYYFHCGFILL